FTIMMAGVALGAFIISRMNTAGREKQLIIITQILTGLAVLSTISLSGVGFVISAFVLHEMFRGAFDPLLGSFLHKRIPSSERATIDSFCSIAPHIAGSIGLLASGLIAESFGIEFAWFISGSILILGAIAVRNGHKNKDPVPDS
ncbi:MAG: MFS transporter, partial [Saprospiraceae bacterium]|nr:MFS transporter [Saprospiraceae bacterium]